MCTEEHFPQAEASPSASCTNRDSQKRKLLKFAKHNHNQRVQTQLRPNILREMPGEPFSNCLPQYFVQNLDNDVHVCMS